MSTSCVVCDLLPATSDPNQIFVLIPFTKDGTESILKRDIQVFKNFGQTLGKDGLYYIYQDVIFFFSSKKIKVVYQFLLIFVVYCAIGFSVQFILDHLALHMAFSLQLQTCKIHKTLLLLAISPITSYNKVDHLSLSHI